MADENVTASENTTETNEQAATDDCGKFTVFDGKVYIL